MQAAIIPIASELAAIVFDVDAVSPPGRGRISGEIDGSVLPRPLVSTRLALRKGGLRHVVLIGRGAAELAGSFCRLSIDDAPAALIDPDWLQSPLRDPVDLVDGLSEDGRRRLLKMFVTTGASLFGGGHTAGFGSAMRSLVGLLGARELAPGSVCAVGHAGRLLSYPLPLDVHDPEISALIGVSQDHVARITGASARVENGPKGRALHVFAPTVAGCDALIAISSFRIVLGIGLEQRRPGPLAPWLGQQSDATRSWSESLVALAGNNDDLAAALAREIRHSSAQEPRLCLRHVSATAQGVLFLAELDDPHGLVAAVRLEHGEANAVIPARGPRVVGFARLAGLDRPGVSVEVRLVYGSGRIQTVGDWPVEPFCEEIPEVFSNLSPSLVAEPLAAARSGPRRRIRSRHIELIGATPARPVVSLVVDAGDDPDVIRARLAMLFSEPAAERVQIIHHAPERHSAAVRRVLLEAHGVFGLGSEVVFLADDTSQAGRLQAALKRARGPATLILGARVLPDAPGWLATWTKSLRRARGPAIIGGALIGPDGALRDAGGAVLRDGEALRIERRWMGLPACDLPGGFAETVRVGANCVGLRDLAVAAFCEDAPDYPESDVVLTDLAMRLREGGARVTTLLGAPFVEFGEGRPFDELRDAVDAEALAFLVRRRLQSEGQA